MLGAAGPVAAASFCHRDLALGQDRGGPCTGTWALITCAPAPSVPVPQSVDKMKRLAYRLTWWHMPLHKSTRAVNAAERRGVWPGKAGVFSGR